MPIDEDNDMSILAYNKYLEDDVERKKKKAANEIEEMGGQFLSEIDRKKKQKNLKSQKLIPYILKHSSNIYDEEELLSYTFEDIQDIYNGIRTEKKPFIIKIFRFLFNIE